MILLQPFEALVLQMSCGVEFVVKGTTIHYLTRLHSIRKTQCAAMWDLISGSRNTSTRGTHEDYWVWKQRLQKNSRVNGCVHNF